MDFGVRRRTNSTTAGDVAGINKSENKSTSRICGDLTKVDSSAKGEARPKPCPFAGLGPRLWPVKEERLRGQCSDLCALETGLDNEVRVSGLNLVGPVGLGKQSKVLRMNRLLTNWQCISWRAWISRSHTS